MLWLKACPRCRGDLYADWDISGTYRQCIQCGYTQYAGRQSPRRAARAA